MAHALGVRSPNAVDGIREFCRSKVQKLIRNAKKIVTIEDLERVVCEQLRLKIIEIWSDGDLDAIVEEYARGRKDAAFAYLRKDLDLETFATLIRCRRQKGENEDHYVAVVDCRGEKATRRFFTRWHEIAHVLTLFEQLELPLHRSTIKKDAVERMMDIVAGDIGFYPPLFSPVVNDAAARSRFDFQAVGRIRQRFCPSASIQATLNAAVAQLELPIIFLDAALGLKKAEERALNSEQQEFFPQPPPVAQLRVRTAISNGPARRLGLKIHSNMRVPGTSVIASVFNRDDEFNPEFAFENLSQWATSGGAHLPPTPVSVDAMRVRDHVWAIIAPTNN
ncbi:MAG TPA: hypothetical protein VM940_05415 [Chthoniobacterales bacterium]|nr:hypothetical protein [Chthoniobacterales bacterium]